MLSLPADRGQGPEGPGGNADTGETRFSRGGPAGRSPRSDPLTPGCASPPQAACSGRPQHLSWDVPVPCLVARVPAGHRPVQVGSAAL